VLAWLKLFSSLAGGGGGGWRGMICAQGFKEWGGVVGVRTWFDLTSYTVKSLRIIFLKNRVAGLKEHIMYYWLHAPHL